jgi:formylglycine-generating enzyme required for sulfatase activity
MMLIPAGEFEMGSKDGHSHEMPVHTVYVDDFYIAQTEVTNAMYAQCVQAGVCASPGAGDFGKTEFANHPVGKVSWYDAVAYCEWANGRLPTEAEWEKAARGGLEGKLYPWGDQDPVCDRRAENGAQSLLCVREGTVPVGSFPPNKYGLYDMAGNVWEWVNSCYRDYPYTAGDGREYKFASCNRVLRGGSFSNQINSLRVAFRNLEGPRISVFAKYGFRCIFSP